jgi:hypothetical protein
MAAAAADTVAERRWELRQRRIARRAARCKQTLSHCRTKIATRLRLVNFMRPQRRRATCSSPQRGGAACLSRGKVALDVEGIIDGGMG